jgi:hypothetical protein
LVGVKNTPFINLAQTGRLHMLVKKPGKVTYSLTNLL